MRKRTGAALPAIADPRGDSEFPSVPGRGHEVGFLAEAFRCFSDLGLSVDLISTAESNVTVTLDTATQAVDGGLLQRLENRLEQFCRVQIIQNAEAVSLVGRKIRATLHEIERGR